jgi:hypothetical protein
VPVGWRSHERVGCFRGHGGAESDAACRNDGDAALSKAEATSAPCRSQAEVAPRRCPATGFPSPAANDRLRWRLSRLQRQQELAFCRNFESGSDGTRTRDLRRDSPLRRSRHRRRLTRDRSVDEGSWRLRLFGGMPTSSWFQTFAARVLPEQPWCIALSTPSHYGGFELRHTVQAQRSPVCPNLCLRRPRRAVGATWNAQAGSLSAERVAAAAHRHTLPREGCRVSVRPPRWRWTERAAAALRFVRYRG